MENQVQKNKQGLCCGQPSPNPWAATLLGCTLAVMVLLPSRAVLASTETCFNWLGVCGLGWGSFHACVCWWGSFRVCVCWWGSFCVYVCVGGGHSLALHLKL